METLKELRKQAGLSAKEVAEKLGVSFMTIYRYESGERQPNLGMVVALAKMYDCTIEEIVLGALKVGKTD